VIATYVGATAAVVAGLLAIYVSVIRPRLRIPRLSVVSSAGDPHTFAYVSSSDGWHGAWGRLRVANAPGHDTAEDVEIMVVDITSPRGTRIETLTPLSGRLLKWAGVDQYSRSIPPGVSIRFDVIKFGLSSDGTRLEKRVCIYPRSRLDQLNRIDSPNTQVVVVVALCARNINARFYEIEIECNGSSWDGMPPMPISMRVRKLRRWSP